MKEQTSRKAPIEILAPVGGHAQLLAAVRCGADAVYLGAKGFNARRNAENFENDTLEDAVAYCHERGVRVYVTLNTLVADDELPSLIETLDEIAASGADAVIVQDLAVAKIAAERYPSLRRFASTQMCIHNAEGTAMAEELGYAQAVLARELSISEIRAIRETTGIELECFVHGALCMCVSGMCYLSSMIGTRSGNRGLCAQPCRLNFRLNGKEYALSLKDMSAIEQIPALEDAGVTSLKIEGRMKRPEYVAAAVSACCAARRGETPELSALRAVFSRSGFTDGYLTGCRTSDMFGVRRKEDVQAASSVLPALAALCEKEPQTIPVAVRFTACSGRPASIEVSDGEHTAVLSGPAPEPAKTVALTRETVEKNLMQTGGTPYRVTQCRVTLDDGLSLPVSVQKGMRRDALLQLGALRRRRVPYENTGYCPAALPLHVPRDVPGIRLRFETAAQIFDAPEAEQIILPAAEIDENPGLIARFGGRLAAEIPAVCFPEGMDRLRAMLTRLKSGGLTAVTAEELGAIRLGREFGFTICGGAGLNVLNSTALDRYRELGLADVTVSFELSMQRLGALTGTLPRGLLVYGYLPLMRMRACPARGKDGCGRCTGKNVLIDERSERFTLLCRGRQYAELLNSVPLYLGDKRIAPVDFHVFRFTVETREEAASVYRAFLSGNAPAFRRTAGLYFRELQ